MKTYIILIAFSLTIVTESYSQSEVLRIKLKNSTTEEIQISQIRKIEFESVGSSKVEDNLFQNTGLFVSGNNPNPFAGQTSIEFEIAMQGNVYILIYDNSGRQIQKLECQNCNEGKNSQLWNCLDASGNSVQSGVYYYEVNFGSEVQNKKMLVVQ